MKEAIVSSNTMERTINKAYDHYCKLILQEPRVLVYVLKYFVSEFQSMSLDEISRYLEQCSFFDKDTIRGSPIKALNLVDESIHKARIEFDSLFQITVPKQNGKQDTIFVNMEVQNEDDPGYHLLTRANYYCYRLLDRQKNQPYGFQNSEFDKMKKVYSIWICLGHPKYKDNVINVYTLCEESVNEEWHQPKTSYQLKIIIMIYLGHDIENKGPYKELLNLMNLLFRFDVPMKEKSKQLKEKYDILLEEIIEEEVKHMYSFAEMTLRQGIEQGIERGKFEGIEIGKHEGKLQATIEHIKSIMKRNDMNEENAMDLLGVEQELRPVVLEKLTNHHE